MTLHSIPDGLTVQLFRGKVVTGESAGVDAWMRMLDDRLEECTATLDRERMGIEIVFRQRDGADEYLYWIVVRGAGESVESSEAQIDLDHLEFDRRCRQRGWETAEPQLLLLPGPVRAALYAHCGLAEPAADSGGGH